MELTDLFTYDPFEKAEEITGRSYADRDTGLLGMALTINHAQRTREFLAGLGDSHMGMVYKDWTELVASLGFTKVWSETFGEPAEVQEAYWRDGVLLVCGSYSGKINGAKIYFTGQVLDEGIRRLGMSGLHYSSGEGADAVKLFTGGMDVREGLKFKLEHIKRHITLDTEWVDGPRVWLANFLDERYDSAGPRPDFDAINRGKLKQFPAPVLEAMGQ